MSVPWARVAMGLTRTTTRASRRRDAAGEPRGDGAYATHIVERGRALRRPNPARGDAGTGLMTPNGRTPQRSSRMHARPPRACAGRKRGFEDARVSNALLGVSEACGGVVKRVAWLTPDGCVAQNGVQERSSRVHARQVVDAADAEREEVRDTGIEDDIELDDWEVPGEHASEAPEGEDACPPVNDDCAPVSAPVVTPQPVRIRGRGHERRLQIAALNHGLKSTSQFWEGERLKMRLYTKIPMPSNDGARGVATRVGNWTAPVYPLDEERRVYERDEDTTIQMFEALERIADGPEERGDKLHAFTQRTRPLQGQLKTYRCRAYPTAKQAKILKKFCQVQTFDAYNAAIDVIKEKPSGSLTWVRNRVKAALNWDKRDVPSHVMDDGAIEGRNAYLSNERKRLKALHERSGKFRYELQHRSPKTTPVVRCTFGATDRGVKYVDRDDASSRTVRLDFARGAHRASAFRELGVVKVREGALGDLEDKINFRVKNAHRHKFYAQKENISFEYDSRRRRWYLVVLYDAPAPPQKKTPAECVDMAVFDLGVRTPATIFSPITGDVFEPYPRELREQIKRRWRRMQKLQSQISKRNWSRERHKRGPKYRRTRKQYARTTRRMKATLKTRHLEFAQWMRWVHRSVAKTVATRYDAIACAPLDLKMIFARRPNDTAAQRVIQRRSRRVTHALSLRRCTEALKYACTQAGKIVVIERAIESGTSKTCGNCGWENDALGHAKEFVCHMCDITIGRDWNGARNNALQVIADGGFGREPRELHELEQNE